MSRVVRLLRTPVKSTMVNQVDHLSLREDGAEGDRRFLFGRLDGSRPSGISKAPLLGVRSVWDEPEERLTLALPDGTVLTGDARAHGEPIEVRLFDRTVPARRVDPVFQEAVDAIDPTLTLLRVDAPEYAGGRHRVSLVASATIAAVGAAGGDAAVDPRRFRMLVEVDGLEAFAEDALEGRRVRLGDAVVRLGGPIPRCVLTEVGPDTRVRDFPALEVLTRDHLVDGRPALGVYGDVETPGTVAVGDGLSID